MKKLVIFLVLLLTLSVVRAQTQMIIEGEYSLIVIAILLFIILSILFFLGVYIKDNIWKIKKFLIEKKEVEEKPVKVINYVKEVNKLEENLGAYNPKDVLSKLQELIKGFFAEIFFIRKQFTYEELKIRLKEKEREISFFIKKLSDLRFSGKRTSKKELRLIIEKFKELVSKEKFVVPEYKTLDKIKYNIYGLFGFGKEKYKYTKHYKEEREKLEKLERSLRKKVDQLTTSGLENKRERLIKKLNLLKRGYESGYIKEDSYKKDKIKLEAKLRGLKKTSLWGAS